mgnify:FL=1
MWSFLKNLSSIIFIDDVEFELSTQPFKSEKFGIPIFSGSHLTPELSHIALRAKEDNDLIARKYLAKLISQAIGLLELNEICVVPIPSRTEANRKRGFAHIDELLIEVAKLNKIKRFDILRHTRKIKDQSGLKIDERFQNLNGAFQVKTGKEVIPNSVFLIDDLITTGATIQAAAAALQVRNIHLLGAISACATFVFTE